MKLHQIMHKRIVGISPNTKIDIAMKLLKSANVDLMPVIDDGRLVGIIDETALLPYSDKNAKSEVEKRVSEIMKRPLFLEENSTVDEAIKYTIKHSLTRLPIVDSIENMMCLGMVSTTELLSAKKK